MPIAETLLTKPWSARGVPGQCGVAAAAIGALVLAGWTRDQESARLAMPGYAAMMPLAAASLVVLGGTVMLAARPPRSARTTKAIVIAAGVVVVAGLVSLAEYLFSASVGIDTLLFEAAVRLERSDNPGRMAPLGAACLAVVGVGVVLLQAGRTAIAHFCGALVSLVAWAAITGYLYSVLTLGSAGAQVGITIHAAIGLDLLALGLMWLTPDHGLLALANRGGPTGLLVRTAVPILVFLPLVAGWLSVNGLRAGWYPPEFALAVIVVVAGTVGGLMLWRVALSIASLDDARLEALSALAESNAGLEAQVAERTASLEAQAAVQFASLEALEQGVTLSSLDGEVLLLNRAGRDLLGYEARELTDLYRSGRWITYREDGSVLPEAERPLGRTMRTGVAVSGEVVQWQDKDGRRLNLRLSTRPITDGSGNLRAVVTAVSDVTAELAAKRDAEDHLAAMTELNEKLAQAVRMKDRFLSTATHDMRSPITTIIGFADLLTHSEVVVSDEKRAAYLQAILRQGRRLEAFVQDLLSVAVIDGGPISLHAKPIELEPAVRQVIADVGLGEGVDVRIARSVAVAADPLRLAQMLTNLLQNAMRYGRPPVVVSAEFDTTSVTMCVSDHGDGVDPAFVPQLFDRFTTARRPVGVESIGTGLGLAIVRGLAQLHGGDAWYEPNEPTGSRFLVRLPAAAAHDTVSPSDGADGEALMVSGER